MPLVTINIDPVKIVRQMLPEMTDKQRKSISDMVQNKKPKQEQENPLLLDAERLIFNSKK